jgi:putative ABC transport system permease protein
MTLNRKHLHPILPHLIFLRRILPRLIPALLFAVTPTDPATFCGVSILLALLAPLALAALAACYIPAQRAAPVDPMVAPRCE